MDNIDWKMQNGLALESWKLDLLWLALCLANAYPNFQLDQELLRFDSRLDILLFQLLLKLDNYENFRWLHVH